VPLKPLGGRRHDLIIPRSGQVCSRNDMADLIGTALQGVESLTDLDEIEYRYFARNAFVATCSGRVFAARVIQQRKMLTPPSRRRVATRLRT
jgi:hypothetical protein